MSSVLTSSPETLIRLKENDLPKKDVLAIARSSGVMAAKKTADMIPYCHPIPIDACDISFELEACKVVITASVEAVSKTGLEMEALTAASISALVLYDMLKPIDKAMEIQSTRLLEKHGGKSDFEEDIPRDFRSAVIVTSDGTYQGARKDKSGKLIQEKLESYGIQPDYFVLPDDLEQIKTKLSELCRQNFHLIVTTGGTGLGPRDVTVEATRAIIDREIPGVVEAARSYGQNRTPYAMLSRGLAGQKGNTMILNLPGSSGGVRETLAAVFPAVFHAYKMMKGEGHDQRLVRQTHP